MFWPASRDAKHEQSTETRCLGRLASRQQQQPADPFERVTIERATGKVLEMLGNNHNMISLGDVSSARLRWDFGKSMLMPLVMKHVPVANRVGQLTNVFLA